MAYGYQNYNMPYQGYNTYGYGQMQQAPKYEIIEVNGENGVNALQMAPNSRVIAMDKTAPIIWVCQTDGAG